MLSARVISQISAIRAKSQRVDYSRLTVALSSLVFIHQVIAATDRHLAEAAEESSGELKAYFERHLEEEKDHASWLSDDLQTAGVDVARLPLVRAAVEFAGSQYYLIKHVHPACLLGHMAVLEGFPTSIADVELLENLHGKELFRTLRHHAQADIEHRQELFSVIDRVAMPCILHSARLTASYMNELSLALANGADFTKEL